ncbi:MAG: LptE family protein [Bacteroidota bacterium]
MGFQRSKLSGFLLIGLLALTLSACGVYSFTGASIPPEAKTISVQYFANVAPLINPTLSQVFTDIVRDRFINQTRLSLVTRSGDLQLEGEIVGYSVSPVAIQGNDQAALNRLSITVNVRYSNKFTPAQDFETKLTRFEDFSSSQSLSSVEGSLVELISKQLADDIFNKSVANW